MGQTMSMLRWIGQSCNGRRGEILYPFPMNPEACYDIDNVIEISEGFAGKLGYPYLQPGGVDDAKAKEMASTLWRGFLFKMDAILKYNGNSNFMVGDCMTIADFSMGTYMLRYCINENQ